MVLADRGVLCIDEFDKMGPQDRVSMHEAMEQQTVTIAKAGIHASLNARCSVLAAANPVYGFYSVRHRLSFNVGLPESLLSRFDLTFIILDQHSSEYNRRIGGHILRNHMTAEPIGFDTAVTKTMLMSDSAAGSAAQQRSGQGNGEGENRMTTNSTGESIVGSDFLRRYIAYAKQMSPLLNEGSQALISQHYVQLRAEQQEGTRDGFLVTARTLEAIVRLATAHAKLRLSLIVDEDDVKGAMELLRASVHAATAATEQREKDEKNVVTEQKKSAGGDNNDKEGVDEAARKRSRTEGGGAAAANSALVSSHLTARVKKALVLFRQEAKSKVMLHELRDRVGTDVDLVTMQRTVSAMDADDFVYESTALEDSITFV
jgi:DNA replication licensing factor MCM3